jgi:hypothetical protein
MNNYPLASRYSNSKPSTSTKGEVAKQFGNGILYQNSLFFKK